MEKSPRKWNGSIVKRTLLILVDIAFINLSSFIALWVRFNMQMSAIPASVAEVVIDVALMNTLGTVIIFALFRLYTSLWRYASIKELVYIIQAVICSFILNALIFFAMGEQIVRSYFAIYAASLFLLTCLSRFSYRLIRLLYRANVHGTGVRNTMIIGAGEACNVVMKELELSTELDARICCIIDDNEEKHGSYIHGVKIIGGRDKILSSARKYGITEIIIAIPSANQQEKQKILEICEQVKNCELKVLPGVYQLVRGEVSISKLRHVAIEDLLGREPVKVTTEKIGRYVSGKSVLVTGGGGSIGSELCRQIAANGVGQLIIFDIYENSIYEIQQELKGKYPNMDLVVLIGSVRNGRRLNDVFDEYRPDIVYHAAAHKHVPLMEDSPNEAIKNNVFGTYKTALAAEYYGVEKFVLISTDKAVNPTNVMGASKRLCEMIVQLFNGRSKTEFVAVRFGNVLGSNGSVIPLFRKQIEAGGPVTVTHPEVIRYFMTIPEAVSLVLQAGASAKGGEIFVLDMGQPMKIEELARNLIRLSGYEPDVDIQIRYTGLRPGEKLYEELLLEEEGLQSTENELIHIGKQIEFDEERFLKELDELYDAAYREEDSIKELLHKMVPTYQPRRMEVRQQTHEKATWAKEFSEAWDVLHPKDETSKEDFTSEESELRK